MGAYDIEDRRNQHAALQANLLRMKADQALQQERADALKRGAGEAHDAALEFLAPDTGTYGEAVTRNAPFTGGMWNIKDIGSDLAKGDWTGAAINTGLGIAGSLPFLGAMKNVGKATLGDIMRGAGNKAKAAEDVVTGTGGFLAPDAVEGVSAIDRLFGTKGALEKKRAAAVRKIARENAATKAEGGTIEKVKGATDERSARPATYYRDMEQAQGQDAVIQDATMGLHLRPSSEGGYVGGPRHVQSPRQLNAMRNMMDEDLVLSAEAMQQAENAIGNPNRIGTWYPRAQAYHKEVNEPFRLDRGLENTSVHSAGASPEIETGFAHKHGVTRAIGDPQMAYRGVPMRTLDSAIAEERPAKLAAKVNEYRNKNDWRIPDDSLFGVNDFRRAQGMGYTTPEGKPWKAGVQATMHPFMDAETALQVQRANAGRLGGVDNWTGAMVQEVPWVGGKAQDIYNPNGRFKGEQGKLEAMVTANNTAADYAPKHMMSTPMPSVPSAGLGHREDILSLPFEDRSAYGAASSWLRGVQPEGSPFHANRDVMHSAVGFPATQASRDLTVLDNGVPQPAQMSYPQVDFRTVPDKKNRVEGSATVFNTVGEPTMESLKAIEGLRGLVDARATAGGSLPVTVPSRSGKNSFLIDSKDLRKNPATMAGEMTSGDDLVKLNQMLSGSGYSMAPTHGGLHLMPNANMTGEAGGQYAKQARTFKKQTLGDIVREFQGAKVSPVGTESFQVPTLGAEQNTGRYTMDALNRFAKAPQEVANKLSESEEVRRVIGNKLQQDASSPHARKDLQETRRFFGEANWAKAVEMIKQGMTPAAAIAALGFSASSMAGQEPQPQ